MDREKAQFILQSFRPDGADARGPEFAEALALATEDRDLGEWLARERATDAAFAAMLNEVEIPEDLRENIFSVLAGEAGNVELDATDASMAGALASITAPAGLREQILHAMGAQAAEVVPMPQSAPTRVSKWLAGAAVAAAVVLGALVALNVPTGGGLSPAVVESSAVGLLSEEGFALDLVSAEHRPVRNWLVSQELPAPEGFPTSLASVPSIGCKELKIGDKPASLICFRLEEGVVHLIVFKRADVEGDLPGFAERQCHGCKKSGWSLASWRDEEHAMFLLGKMEPATLDKVLF